MNGDIRTQLANVERRFVALTTHVNEFRNDPDARTALRKTAGNYHRLLRTVAAKMRGAPGFPGQGSATGGD